MVYRSKSITLTRANARSLFDRVHAEYGRLDIFACAVWGGNEHFIDPIWKQPFWKLPAAFWDDFMGAGPQAFWIAAREAARLMSERGSGLIAAISEPMIDMDKLSGSQQWDLFEHLPHYALNRLVVSLAPEARKAGITLLGLLPGFMKTERVQVHMQDEALQKLYRYDLAESTEYTGRAVVALASDPNVIAKSGHWSLWEISPRNTDLPISTAATSRITTGLLGGCKSAALTGRSIRHAGLCRT